MPIDIQQETPPPTDNAITNNTGSSDNGVPSNDLTAPAVEPAQAASSAPASAEGTTEGGEGAAETNADGTKRTPWFQRRIDQLTAEKWEERRTAESLRKQTAELLAQLAEARKTAQSDTAGLPVTNPATTPTDTPQASSPATPKPAPRPQSMSDAEINALAERRAEEIACQRTFNKVCNDVAEAGKDEYPDFDQSLRTFQMLGGIPTGLLETITEMPNAHKILYSLGKDPDLAERVVKMSPGKQALELARMESSLGKPVTKAVSSAPPPVRPIDATSRAVDDPEKMSMDEFVKWREKNLAGRKK